MGNSHNAEDSIPHFGTPQLDKVFLRRKKVIAECKYSATGTGFTVFDTLKTSRRIKVSPERIGLEDITPFDASTFLNVNKSVHLLELIDIATGEVEKSIRIDPWITYSYLAVVGEYIFLGGNQFTIRVRKDFSSLRRIRHPQGTSVVAGVEINRRLGNLYSIPGGAGTVKIRDPKEMVTLKKIEIPPASEGQYSFLRRLDSWHLVLVSKSGIVTLVNIKTEKVTHFKHFYNSTPLFVSIYGYQKSKQDGIRKAWIFLGFAKKVEALFFNYSQEGKVVANTSVRKEITKVKNLQGMTAVDEDKVLCLGENGKFEVWRVGHTTPIERECLYKRETGKDARKLLLVPLTSREEKEETLRFRRELESYGIPIPKELLGVVAGFI